VTPLPAGRGVTQFLPEESTWVSAGTTPASRRTG